MASENMTTANPVAELKRRGRIVEQFLQDYPLKNPVIPQRLKDAMLYSLNAGGKRFRPALCMASASVCGLDEMEVVPFAAAIEMIHTYSLIHDDLPAMDNDDLRRGRPSNHRAFDEATAILAGDGLLTDAFAVVCSLKLDPLPVLRAARELALAAGSCGMVGGQMLDMLHTGRGEASFAELKQMHALKTGAMIRASCVCGAILANASDAEIEALGKYGAALGRAFQIADDILDVTGDTKTLGKPVGSDEKSGKLTYPALLGLEKSRQCAQEATDEAKASLAIFRDRDVSFLLCLADYVTGREA